MASLHRLLAATHCDESTLNDTQNYFKNEFLKSELHPLGVLHSNSVTCQLLVFQWFLSGCLPKDAALKISVSVTCYI